MQLSCLSALQHQEDVHPDHISHPAALLSKVYLDIMEMPEAQGKNWIVAR